MISLVSPALLCHDMLQPVTSAIEHNSAKYLHLLIEAMQLSFADTTWYCTDPYKVNVPVDKMLCKDYAAQRRNLIKPDR